MEKLSNNKLKWIKSLHYKKHRDIEKYFILEGEKSIRDIYSKYPNLVKEIFISENIYIKYFQNAIIIDKIDMSKISTLKTNPGILAICSTETIKNPTSKLTLLLDKIRDPGNLGTIIRTASWFGVDHIICSEDSVDCFNPKVVQSSMGTIFNVKIEYKDLSKLKKDKIVYGTYIDAPLYYNIDINENCYLLMGNESKGISENLKKLIDKKISIPKIGDAESLNLSVATGIFLNYIVNQKKIKL